MKLSKVCVSIPLEMLQKSISYLVGNSMNPEIFISEYAFEAVSLAEAANLRNQMSHNPLITIHGPFMTLMPGSPNVDLRNRTLAKWIQTLEYAKAFGASQIVLHGGANDPGLECGNEEWLENSIPLWLVVIELAISMDCNIVVENTYELDPAPLKMLMDNLEAENFGICLDVGHMNLPGRGKNEKWFKDLGKSVMEVHMHDNHGSADSHLALGAGNVDFQNVFECIDKYTDSPVITLECRTKERVTESLCYIEEKW